MSSLACFLYYHYFGGSGCCGKVSLHVTDLAIQQLSDAILCYLRVVQIPETTSEVCIRRLIFSVNFIPRLPGQRTKNIKHSNVKDAAAARSRSAVVLDDVGALGLNGLFQRRQTAGPDDVDLLPALQL